MEVGKSSSINFLVENDMKLFVLREYQIHLQSNKTEKAFSYAIKSAFVKG